MVTSQEIKKLAEAEFRVVSRTKDYIIADSSPGFSELATDGNFLCRHYLATQTGGDGEKGKEVSLSKIDEALLKGVVATSKDSRSHIRKSNVVDS